MKINQPAVKMVLFEDEAGLARKVTETILSFLVDEVQISTVESIDIRIEPFIDENVQRKFKLLFSKTLKHAEKYKHDLFKKETV
jgi:hypothetical protein